MAFDVVAASYQEREAQRSPLELVLRTGGMVGFAVVFSAAVGLLVMFHQRWIVADMLSLGHTVLAFAALTCGGVVARKTRASGVATSVALGFGAGLVAAAMVAVLLVLMANFNLRTMFVALALPLQRMLSFEGTVTFGVTILLLGGAIVSALGAVLYRLSDAIRRPIVIALGWTAMIGLFQEILQLLLQAPGLAMTVRQTFFTWDGLHLRGAITIFIAALVISALWLRNREQFHAGFATLPQARQKAIRGTSLAVLLLLIFLFPLVAGNFIGQVLMLVGLFILMGLGLNIEVGLAGLLDLGFVAFFAVGAYTTALLTADSPYALASWSYWQALPVAVLLSLFVGVLFGVPVLRVRGDYLAVATLGLGEIVRVIVISDMAEPILGGAQGILSIPRPSIGEFQLDNPVKLFYLTLACAALVAYCAWRLENSRLGRAWMAIRDDEDVAQALGINLVNVKLLAYGLGAAFAGVAGSIFGVMLGSIFPHSFQLLISINILALIIVGGMGSIPGVIIGALVLIGTPELLREFGEFRFLFYGLVIVLMMRVRPAGLWPSASRKRELQEVEEASLAAIRGGSGASGSTPR
jgi:branched-chain amino acid transport system permease protein